MVLIFFGPFALNYLLLPLLLFIQSWFIYITPVKYNTICPNTYVISAYSIIKIYAIKDGFINTYITSGLCHSTHGT
jgi:hypothetical protein